MDSNGFRARVLRGDKLCGTFLKTPSHELVEVLALSGLDFICLDGEHAAWTRSNMDACLAVAKALGFPCLVRVPEGTPAQILMALDGGAAGVVVPHVFSAEKAADVSKAARFGHGGRGFAGSTRFAGWATRPMADVLKLSDETLVLGQIEEPEGVAAVDEIAATPGLDGLFVGPADLAVAYGETDLNHPKVRTAIGLVGAAAAQHNKAAVTFAPSTDSTAALRELGVTMFFFASEHAWMLQGARAAAAAFREQAG